MFFFFSFIVYGIEFLLCPEEGGSDSLSEASVFLSKILSSQQFLQVSLHRMDIPGKCMF